MPGQVELRTQLAQPPLPLACGQAPEPAAAPRVLVQRCRCLRLHRHTLRTRPRLVGIGCGPRLQHCDELVERLSDAPRQAELLAQPSQPPPPVGEAHLIEPACAPRIDAQRGDPVERVP
eukprot:2110338-Prymnesium_polylepis.2